MTPTTAGFITRGSMATPTGRVSRRKAAVLVTLDGFSRSGNKRSPTRSVASRLPTGVTGTQTIQCQHTTEAAA